MKNITLSLILMLSISISFSQKAAVPTNQVVITGAVEKEVTIEYARILEQPARALTDLVITNHLGEPRGTARGLKGVLLRDVLKQAAIQAENPRVLSEFYFTLVASDGYKAVFSWNELFNSETGNHVFVVTEKEGKPLADLPERILVITETDFKTGRRYVKNVERIVVARTP
jgi:hypothetical protein